jgi:hypothetical protein
VVLFLEDFDDGLEGVDDLIVNADVVDNFV